MAPTSLKQLPTMPCSPYRRCRPTCYFTIQPPSPAGSSSSSDAGTPLSSPFPNLDTTSDPHFPLLAYREPDTPTAPPSAMDASKLMSLQTAAAFSNFRPKAQPIQDVLEINTDEPTFENHSSSSLSSASSSSSSTPTMMPRRTSLDSEFIRCSRCQRASCLSSPDSKSRMVSYGTNLYYCNRCAKIVGYGG